MRTILAWRRAKLGRVVASVVLEGGRISLTMTQRGIGLRMRDGAVADRDHSLCHTFGNHVERGVREQDLFARLRAA